MLVKKILFKSLKKLGLRITRYREVDDEWEAQKWLTSQNKGVPIIFDIGAFDGDTALLYSNLFPKAKIYAFEPFKESFDLLEKNTASLNNVSSFNLGVGDFTGTTEFRSNKYSQANSLLPTHEKANDMWGANIATQEVVEVKVTTVDDFISEQKLEKIDVLKLDVQGAEYNVIMGAKDALEKGKIDVIYTEVLNVPTYEGQKELHEIIEALRSFNYTLFNLYAFERNKQGKLRQLDAIFVSPRIKKLYNL